MNLFTCKIDRWGIVSIALNIASVAINTTAEQTFTIQGLQAGDMVFVNKPSLNAGLGIVNARVSAANTLALTLVNATGAAIDPGSETYLVLWIRPERTQSIAQE